MIRVLLAYLGGAVGYAVGFLLGGVAGVLAATIALWTPAGDSFMVGLTGSALAAHLLAWFLFGGILKKENKAAEIGFAVLLLCFAGLYAAGALFDGDLRLLWYPVLSIGLNIVILIGSAVTAAKKLPK